MHIGHGRLCLSVCPSPHSYTTARTQIQLVGMVGMPCSIGRICNRCTGFVAMITYTYASLQPYTLQMRIAEREVSACIRSVAWLVFSERELTFTFAICYRPSVCRLSVTFVRPTQAVQIFGNISTVFGTLAIR